MEKMKLPILNDELINNLKYKALNEIKNSKEFVDIINQFNLTDEEIMNAASKFLKVRDDKKSCLNCKGKCNKNPKQVQLDLVIYDNREIDIEFNTCDYYKRINELKKHYLYLDFPIEYLEYDFSKELKDNDYTNVRKKVLVKLIKILNDNVSKGLYIYGNNRIGKSFIAALFSKIYIEKTNKRVAFCNSSDLFQYLSDLNFSDKNALRESMESLIDVDLLVLDGFGNEYKSDFVRDNYVYPLLISRLEKNKLTLITSNFKIQEIVDMYTLSKASAPKAKQLLNILNTICEEVELLGHSFPL